MYFDREEFNDCIRILYKGEIESLAVMIITILSFGILPITLITILLFSIKFGSRKDADCKRGAFSGTNDEMEKPASECCCESQTKCPECLKAVTQDELDTFGGLCEECTVDFD